jgi:hypothetical protein
VWKRKPKSFDYEGDPADYARLVFRRYGRNGSYPAKRGHTISIIVFFLTIIAFWGD